MGPKCHEGGFRRPEALWRRLAGRGETSPTAREPRSEPRSRRAQGKGRHDETGEALLARREDPKGIQVDSIGAETAHSEDADLPNGKIGVAGEAGDAGHELDVEARAVDYVEPLEIAHHTIVNRARCARE